MCYTLPVTETDPRSGSDDDARRRHGRTPARPRKKAVAAGETGDAATAVKFQKVVQSLVDKAAKGSTLHKNTAARRKSRLAKRLKALQAAQA